MQDKKRYWYAFAGVLLFVAISIGVSGWLWSRHQASRTSPTQSTAVVSGHTATAQTTQQTLLDMHKAVTLVIPSIGVNAPVEMVGTDTQGRMAVPQLNRWEHVGWYQSGPVPGQQGSAVIDGHLDRPGGSPAVFWDLHKMQVGDEVQVKDTLGHTLRFRVYKVQSYAPDAAPLEQIFGDASGSYLNLITCAGQWIPAQHQTTQRLVVYTKLEQ